MHSNNEVGYLASLVKLKVKIAKYKVEFASPRDAASHTTVYRSWGNNPTMTAVLPQSPTHEELTISCGYCLKSSSNLKLCSACKSIYYCNVDCQRQHRHCHRDECHQKKEIIDTRFSTSSTSSMVLGRVHHPRHNGSAEILNSRLREALNSRLHEV